MIKKELAEGQLFPMQELTIRQQENGRLRVTLSNARDDYQTTREGQTTRECSEKCTDTKPSVIKKELAEGQRTRFWLILQLYAVGIPATRCSKLHLCAYPYLC